MTAENQRLPKLARYVRHLGLAAIIASAAHLGYVAILSGFHIEELHDISKSIPIAYSIGIFVLGIRSVAQRTWGLFKMHAVCGILEGAVLAYAWISIQFLSEPSQWNDGTFRWIMFFVGLLVYGLLFSTLGAVVHLFYAAYVYNRDSLTPSS